MDTKERARIATAAATRARRMTKWRRWAAEMRENGFTVTEPETEPAPLMLAVLRWDRFPTWPSAVVGSIVDDRTEAAAMANTELVRSLAQGRQARFTVHSITWPPLADVETGK